MPPGADGPYLIAFAAIYGLIEVSKFIAHKRNHIVPRMADQLSELIRGQDKMIIQTKEYHSTLTGTLERIERKVETE